VNRLTCVLLPSHHAVKTQGFKGYGILQKFCIEEEIDHGKR